jgi:NAD(P)-dependent dehydrogenase (short-subunit alcohol dehydrogenase family)
VATTKRSEAEARALLAARNPQGRFITPQEVADTVLWLCTEGAASITGQAISLSGGETW